MKQALTTSAKGAIPLMLVARKELKAWSAVQKPEARRWLEATGFTAEPNSFALVPAKDGSIAFAVAGVGEALDTWSIAGLSTSLPPHTYTLDARLNKTTASDLALGWALGAYQFTRYKKSTKKPATLVMPKTADAKYVQAMVEAFTLARDMINTPANDMLPDSLAATCIQTAKDLKAQVKVIVGQELIKQNYPTIYTVGKGSVVPPRLVDIRWGRKGAPKVTLVGKGVCFDSGGLNIKPPSAMKLMKKDMAGVAILLALGTVIMKQKLDVQLRILLPMVENAVSGSAMRPLDVVKTRKGITVEIGDTDAEGRLTMCDALAEGDSEKPDLLIDCSTLTGAARIAVGTETAAFFSTHDGIAAKLAKHSAERGDPLYRLPLNTSYRSMIDSKVADVSNDAESGYAGAITAALFLKEFVENAKCWLHLDMMAWNLKPRPGRPVGAEAQGLRSLYHLIEELYG